MYLVWMLRCLLLVAAVVVVVTSPPCSALQVPIDNNSCC